MNCKHVQGLLPLYVGRDLEEKHAKLVTAHVQCCAECASSADEYRETRQLLQQFAPPPFSDAVYAGIRQRVLREIGRESTSPTLPQLVASLFRPRMRWAFATALLLAVCVFAFYFSTNRSNERKQVANHPRTVDRTPQGEQPNARSRESALSSSSSSNKSKRLVNTGVKRSRSTGADPAIAGSTDPMQRSQRRKSPGAGVDQSWSVAVTPDTRSMTVETSPKDNILADPDVVPAGDPASSQKTLRMEIQTKDRNIRIIWFSHQPTKQDSSSETSKGI